MSYALGRNCTRTESIDDNNEPIIVIHGQCISSGKFITVTAPKNAFEEWQKGEYIQKVLRMLSADDREFLISGISGEAFDTLCDKADEMDETAEAF